MIFMGHDHLPDGTLAALAGRRLPPGEIAEVLRHLEVCLACRRRAAEYAEGNLRDFFGDDEHLDDADLIAYVDAVARPDQIEIVETHVEDCALCGARLDDLLALRARKPRRGVRWIAIAASLLLAIVLLGIFVSTREEPRVAPQVTAAPDAGRGFSPPAPEGGGLKPRPTLGERLVTEAVASGELPFPAILATLAGEPDGLRGSSSERVRVSPAGVVVDTTRPEFSWPAREGSSVVVVYEGETEIARSEPLQGRRWKPSRELRRGRTYAWQVEVTKDGETDYLPAPPAPPAMFRIASEEEHEAIDEALRERPDDRLLHAVLYARAGLRAEALASLRAAGDNPDARRILVRYEIR